MELPWNKQSTAPALAALGAGLTACDYEATVVSDNSDDSAFGFKGDEDTTLAMANEGHASSHSLSLTDTAGMTSEVTVFSKTLTVGSECRGLSLWIKVPAAKHLICMVVYNTDSEIDEEQHVELMQASDDWRLVTLPITKKANRNSLKLQLTIAVQEWEGSPSTTFLVDDIKLTSATTPYDYQTGTSMAAPAVTGSAAVLAAAFPEDDAAKRAARIVGSVKPVDDLANMCVSGGVFRLDKAFEQDTNPVLNGASTQADTVAIEGYFFGDGPGSISADGQQLTVVSWSDTSIVAQLPSGFTLSTVALPWDVNLADSWYSGAYDEEGNGYLFCGTTMQGFFKFSFVDGNVTYTKLKEGPLIGGGSSNGLFALFESVEGFVAISQDKRMVAGPTKSGIIASGPVMTDGAGVVIADTYTVNWGTTKFEPTDKQMGVTKICNIAGTTYRGQFYVIGVCESEVGGWVFASEPVETLEQPGDVPGTVEPEQPSEPSDPGQAGKASNPSGSATRQASSASKLPETGDPLSPLASLLAVLGATCLIAANRERRAYRSNETGR